MSGEQAKAEWKTKQVEGDVERNSREPPRLPLRRSAGRASGAASEMNPLRARGRAPSSDLSQQELALARSLG